MLSDSESDSVNDNFFHKERNRIHAQNSRERRKIYIQLLHKRVQQLLVDGTELRRIVDEKYFEAAQRAHEFGEHNFVVKARNGKLVPLLLADSICGNEYASQSLKHEMETGINLAGMGTLCSPQTTTVTDEGCEKQQDRKIRNRMHSRKTRVKNKMKLELNERLTRDMQHENILLREYLHSIFALDEEQVQEFAYLDEAFAKEVKILQKSSDFSLWKEYAADSILSSVNNSSNSNDNDNCTVSSSTISTNEEAALPYSSCCYPLHSVLPTPGANIHYNVILPKPSLYTSYQNRRQSIWNNYAIHSSISSKTLPPSASAPAVATSSSSSSSSSMSHYDLIKRVYTISQEPADNSAIVGQPITTATSTPILNDLYKHRNNSSSSNASSSTQVLSNPMNPNININEGIINVQSTASRADALYDTCNLSHKRQRIGDCDSSFFFDEVYEDNANNAAEESKNLKPDSESNCGIDKIVVAQTTTVAAAVVTTGSCVDTFESAVNANTSGTVSDNTANTISAATGFGNNGEFPAFIGPFSVHILSLGSACGDAANNVTNDVNNTADRISAPNAAIYYIPVVSSLPSNPTAISSSVTTLHPPQSIKISSTHISPDAVDSINQLPNAPHILNPTTNSKSNTVGNSHISAGSGYSNNRLAPWFPNFYIPQVIAPAPTAASLQYPMNQQPVLSVLPVGFPSHHLPPVYLPQQTGLSCVTTGTVAAPVFSLVSQAAIAPPAYLISTTGQCQQQRARTEWVPQWCVQSQTVPSNSNTSNVQL